MSDFNYPSQIGKYKVVTLSGADWKQHRTARLDISVGQPYHEGEKFLATIEWAKHRFSSVIVSVADSLQRYNIAFQEKISLEEAENIALKNGDEWIERHAPFIRSLPEFEITRWNQWLEHPGFSEKLHSIQEFYVNNRCFADCINANITSIWERKVGSHPAFIPDYFDEFAAFSRKYLLEETAAFGLIFKERQAVDIYPGSLLFMWDFLEEQGAPEALSSLKNGYFTRIDFRRNRNAQELRMAS